MKTSDVVFTVIRLDEESKRNLLKFLIELPVGKFDKFYCDHITMEFGSSITAETLMKIGTTKFIRIADKAVVTDKVAYLPCQVQGLEHAHITLATAFGITPVQSKIELEKNPYAGNYTKSQLRGTMVAYMKDQTIIDHV